jgi:hypothetical protein
MDGNPLQKFYIIYSGGAAGLGSGKTGRDSSVGTYVQNFLPPEKNYEIKQRQKAHRAKKTKGKINAKLIIWNSLYIRSS